MKASLTTLIVAAVMLAARQFGEQMAGLLAGLPLTTASMLAWVGAKHGAAAAAQVSIGSVIGCSVVCLFAVSYARAARRLPPIAAMGVGLAVLVAGSALGNHIAFSLWLASGSAIAASLVALTLIRLPAARTTVTAPPMRPRPHFMLALTAASAGVTCALIDSLGSMLDPQLAGVLAAWPVVGCSAVMSVHASSGQASATSFLRGYVVSSLGKAAFGAVFALTAVSSGVAAAMCLAILVGTGIGAITFRLARSPVPVGRQAASRRQILGVEGSTSLREARSQGLLDKRTQP